jgi:RNA-directed DNA polymerase
MSHSSSTATAVLILGAELSLNHLSEFPGPPQTVVVGTVLEQVIMKNGFQVNPRKTRLQSRHQRQTVTGLTVNKQVNVSRRYIRHLRAMLFSWQKKGFQQAEIDFVAYDKKIHHRNPSAPPPDFESVIRGKLEYLRMVRGQGKPYDKYYRLFRILPRK